jgi:hypothetical protein
VNKSIANDVLGRLELFAEANGETWTFADSVGARVWSWETGSNVWRATEVDPSSEALIHVACSLLEDRKHSGTPSDEMMVDAVHVFMNDATLDNLMGLAHALKGIEWRPAD